MCETIYYWECMLPNGRQAAVARHKTAGWYRRLSMQRTRSRRHAAVSLAICLDGQNQICGSIKPAHVRATQFVLYDPTTLRDRDAAHHVWRCS